MGHADQTGNGMDGVAQDQGSENLNLSTLTMPACVVR